MPTPRVVERPSRLKLLAAYAAIYFIWGGSYLAIRYAVEVLPPFLMMGTRHLIAGTLLYAAMRWRGTPKPKLAHWVGAIVAGGFLFLGDHGLLAWAEQRVPSGLAALLSATLPFWMVAAARLKGIEPKLNFRALAGLAIGLAGVALLVGPGAFGPAGWGYLTGAGAILFGAILWVAGSLYARGTRLPDSPLLSAAMQMISGGALLLVAGTLIGRPAGYTWTR